jgi:hypothetical protein
MGTTSGTGTVYPSGAPELTLCFCWVRVSICVLWLLILLLSTIFILDFGIVATTLYFFYFHFIYIIANFARNKSCFVRKLLIGDFTETNDKIY